jgi:hypothetical protein
MKTFFNYRHADIPQESLQDKRLFMVSKKFIEHLSETKPQMMHQLKVLPVALYAFAYNKLPRDIAKHYKKYAVKGTTKYYHLPSVDDLGMVKLSDEYHVSDIKVVW